MYRTPRSKRIIRKKFRRSRRDWMILIPDHLTLYLRGTLEVVMWGGEKIKADEKEKEKD